MRKKRKNHTEQEMVFILKWHLVYHVGVSDLCDEYKLPPTGLILSHPDLPENSIRLRQAAWPDSSSYR